MIGVDERDQNFQKFLWWTKGEMRVLRHCRVIFGINCSPFILAAVLEYHLTNAPDEYREAADLLLRSLYVDNCATSLNSLEEYQEFKVKTVALLADAKMELRQWESNEDGQENHMPAIVLGMRWDKKEDSLFCLPPELKNELVVTKRSVLSVVAQVFDPIGFACPALLPPKLMLQDSWATKIGWDQEWDTEQVLMFRRWYTDLYQVGLVRIPRQAFQGGCLASLQLHTFCDASKKAYGAVVYARTQAGEKVVVQLLAAKSRLAPLDNKKNKSTTINRLELMGCLIGVRLAKAVKASLGVDQAPRYFWCDSTTALAWIRREEDWGTFVGNRSREIALSSSKNEWRYVPGHLNPADLPSRGCTPTQLRASRWWEGPEWLKAKGEAWPNPEEFVDEIEVIQERKKTASAVATASSVQPRFSSYPKNVRVAAYVRRFIENCRAKGQVRLVARFPIFEEMKRGERDILYRLQQCHYVLKPELKGLSVCLMDDKLYHIKTRLLYKEDTELFRYPVLLPGDDPLVHQLIVHIHRSNCHAGAQFVLGKLRERYWILRGRKTVSRIIQRCTVCRRFTSKGVSCDPVPLPKNRVETQYAFQTTGVDLAGPLLLKGGKKAWIVLFTCALYRGIHLDIVDSLSAEEFLDSLEKFACSFGRPSTIYSDNGTNFVGAHNLMKRLDWKKIESLLPVKKIQWSFNPPTGAWWGGWWERLIRSVKDQLRRMLGMAKLTRKELDKCLVAVAYTMNNRPLTTLTEDSNDLIPLVPAMFMRDLPISGLPEREYVAGEDLQESYRKIRDLKRALMERFRKEYLGNLVQMKANKCVPAVAVGDVVLVGADNKRRFAWPLGRILEMFPGKDGKIRVAKVKTAQGVMIRPVQRLYPLEVPSSRVFPKPMESDPPVPTGGDPVRPRKDKDPTEKDCDLPRGDLAVPGKSPIPPGKGQVTRSGRVVRRNRRYEE